MNKPAFTAGLCVILLLVAGGISRGDPPGADSREDTIITSGRVNTSGKFTFKYGKIEASIKLPKTADGLWPAFWMLGADFFSRGWPQCGEIDIVEMGHKAATGNNTQDRYFTGAAHWGTQRGNEHPNYALPAISGYSLQDGFHLYTLLWDETGIRMYLDTNPQPYFVMDTTAAAVKDFFHKPYFIVFNLAVGGDLPEIYDASLISALNADNNYEARMYIDFLNVYDTSGNPLWQTEFNEQTLDSGRWNIEEDDRGGGNHELQSYRKTNVFLGTEPETNKRCLILSAKKQPR